MANPTGHAGPRKERADRLDRSRVAWLNQFDPYSPLAGGVERSIREVGSRLSRLGHAVTVVSERWPGIPRSDTRDGMELLRPSGRVGVHFWTMKHMGAEYRSSPYDVAIQDLAKIVPWTVPGARVRTPSVMFLHHLFGKHIMNEVTPFEAVPLMTLERVVPWLERSADWVTETELHRTFLRRTGVPAQKIHVIRPGVDHSTFGYKAGTRAPGPVIAYTGRLKRYKRVDLAIRAAATLKKTYPDLELWIAGTGNEAPRLGKLVDKLGMTRTVRFKGPVSEEELANTYRRAWVNVQPSIVEGWGFTILEAAACGTPTVAFRNSVFPETVGPPAQPFLAEEGSISSLTEELADCLAVMASHGEAMAQDCVRYTLQYNWDKTASEYSALLDSIASTGAG